MLCFTHHAVPAPATVAVPSTMAAMTSAFLFQVLGAETGAAAGAVTRLGGGFMGIAGWAVTF